VTLSRQRAFVTPRPGEDWNALAQRTLPGEPLDAAVAKLKSWNLHLFVRVPPGSFFGSDVIFVEPPHESLGSKEADESRPTRSEAKPSEGRQPERERSASAKARQGG
jgi:hypothetical protein